MTVLDEINLIIADPAASDWLRSGLAACLGRDPIDAANDAEILAGLLARHAQECLNAIAGGESQGGPIISPSGS